MVAVIVAEKPSAARNMAGALGGQKGSYKGVAYEIASLRGHLYEFAQPQSMVDQALADRYRTWSLANLPWELDDLDWRREPQPRAADAIKALRTALSRADEVVIATDLDPSGEGDLLFWEAVDELGFHGKRFTRMEFTDEAQASLRRAFETRRAVRSMLDEGDYRKAMYRTQWDYLSIQFTRVASIAAGQRGVVVRQGRLKSAMVKLVGDQLKAYEDYVRKPFFQNRFRDENGVMYTNPEEPRFDQEPQVPQLYGPSPVVLDSRTDKNAPPPRLLDLAALSSILVGRGVKAKAVLDTYQKMYEAQVVSYPRTEDKTITRAQFDELLPLADRIAGVVGVDPKLLTHRSPRRTHVAAHGAHGANRPGPKVPASLDSVAQAYGQVGRQIYEILAKNYLATLAEDYLYEQQKGHVEKYPAFVGAANVPRSQGWKLVFDPDAGDDPGDKKARADDGDGASETALGLGTTAHPFVFEGANKRPEHPSMKWLMKQLEKRDVGTGATRTSTYSEVTSTTAKHPLLVENGRKLMLAEAGKMSWLLLPGTHIGDLGLTEKVHADMRRVAADQATADELLREVAHLVRDDIETMRRNAAAMHAELGLTAQTETIRAEGVWLTAPGGPQRVAFRKVFSGHEFTDDEVRRLLAGEAISFVGETKSGKPYGARGALGAGTFKGRKFVGFQLEAPDGPTAWCGHEFTDAEKRELLAGNQVVRDDWTSTRTGNAFSCAVAWDGGAKKIVPDFGSDDEPPRSWCQVVFTDQQREDLAAGRTIEGKGFLSRKSGRTFDAKLTWKDRGGGKKELVPSFG